MSTDGMGVEAAGPASHRRRPGRLGRFASRVGAILLILATLAAGHEIIEGRPDEAAISGYFLRQGAVGDRVSALDFSATALAVRGGQAIVTDLGNEELHTNGVWVLVKVRLEAHEERQSVSFAAIYDRRGRTFDATNRYLQPLTSYRFQPGMPVEGELVFELPRDAVPGARLRLFNGSVASFKHQTLIEIDLGLTETSLDAWVDNREPMRVAVPEVRL